MAIVKKVIGIDPGQAFSAGVVWDGTRILDFIFDENEEFTKWLRSFTSIETETIGCACEMVQSFGMPVGKSVFETVLWIGRFDEVWRSKTGVWTKKVYRKDIKLHFCRSNKAKDSNIRLALVDRFGEPGTKKKPGITHGLSGDLWSAFAVAVYYVDTRKAALTAERLSQLNEAGSSLPKKSPPPLFSA